MKLKSHGVGGEGAAGQSRPIDRTFTLLEDLLAGSALFVKGDDVLGPPREIGDDEADAWMKLAVVPDLGDDAARWGLNSAKAGELLRSESSPAH